jgi:hypothetical protein
LNRILNVEGAGYFIANTNNPTGYSFTLNRLSLLSTEASKNLEKIISTEVYACYRSFLQENSCYHPESIFRLNKELIKSVGNDTAYYTGDKLLEALQSIPDLVCYKLYKLDKNRNFETCSVEFLSLRELLSKDYILWNYNEFLSVTGLNLKLGERQAELYGIINTFTEPSEKSYFISSGIETTLLTDNDPTFSIFVNPLHTHLGVYNMVFGRINVTNIVVTSQHDQHLGHVQGIWTGSIIEMEIQESNFAFLGQYKLAVKKNSNLNKYIKELFSNNQRQKICSLVKKLEDANNGVIDPSIEHLLEKRNSSDGGVVKISFI